MTKPAIAFAAATAAALTLPAAARAAPQIDIAAPGPVIELSIHESVDVAPDTATIGAGVTTEAPTASAALRENSSEMQKVVDRIKALGIAERDIQTTGIGLNPRYDYDQATQRPVFRGYQASNRVSITLRRIAETGSVLDALVAAGATDLNGPVFTIADPAPAEREARQRATARGTAQARAYAAMLGYADVKVLAITESLSGTGMPLEAKARVQSMDAAATAAPVQPGMVSAGVHVTITYALVGEGGAGAPAAAPAPAR